MLGWLNGRDIEWREQVGQRDAEQTRQDREQRSAAKGALQEALTEAGELTQATGNDQQQLNAAIGYIGKTPAPLVLLPLEDALASIEQPNLPGPGHEHPNWRRRWSRPAEELLQEPDAAERLMRLNETRRALETGHAAPGSTSPLDRKDIP